MAVIPGAPGALAKAERQQVKEGTVKVPATPPGWKPPKDDAPPPNPTPSP